jgi:hypothetical protein
MSSETVRSELSNNRTERAWTHRERNAETNQNDMAISLYKFERIAIFFVATT